MQNVSEIRTAIGKLVGAAAAGCSQMCDLEQLHAAIDAEYWRAVADVTLNRAEPTDERDEPAPVRWQAKREAVLTILADDHLKHETNRSIADRARVSATFVAKVRRELEGGEKQANVASAGAV